MLDDNFVNGLQKLDVCGFFVNGSLERKAEYLCRNSDMVGYADKKLLKIGQCHKCNEEELQRSLLKRPILILA